MLNRAERLEHGRIHLAVWSLIIAHFLQIAALSQPLGPRRLPGDVDGDGRITSIDASLAMQYAVQLRIPPTLESEKAADVSRNGRIDAIDGSLIMQLALKMRPLGIISAERTSSGLPATYLFTSTVTGRGLPYVYSWDFNGDQKEDSNQPTAAWQFTTAGTYTVTLKVTDSKGMSLTTDYKLIVDVARPPKPENLLVHASHDKCQLFWDEVTYKEIQGYDVHRRTVSETAFAPIARVDDAFYLDLSLEDGKAYEYYVTAVDLSGNESDPSAVVKAVPGSRLARPLWKKMRQANGGLELEWQPVAEASAYQLFVGDGAGSRLQIDQPVAQNSITLPLGQLPKDHRLYFAVAAVDSQGRWGAFSKTMVTVVLSSLTDSDNDGLPDAWGAAYGLTGPPPLATQDPDHDGLTNLEEYRLGTDPTKSDSDGDGLADGAEQKTYHTDPLNEDSDGGGMVDGAEVDVRTNPLNSNDDLPPPPEVPYMSRLQGTTLRMVWDRSPGAQLFSYNLYYKRGAFGVFTKVNPSPIADTAYAFTVPEYDIDLIFSVRAIDPAGKESPLSGLVMAKFTLFQPDRGATVALNDYRLTAPAQATSQPCALGLVSFPSPCPFTRDQKSVQILPMREAFQVPPTLCLPYNTNKITPDLAKNLCLAIYEANGWENVSGAAIDTTSGLVTASYPQLGLAKLNLRLVSAKSVSLQSARRASVASGTDDFHVSEIKPAIVNGEFIVRIAFSTKQTDGRLAGPGETGGFSRVAEMTTVAYNDPILAQALCSELAKSFGQRVELVCQKADLWGVNAFSKTISRYKEASEYTLSQSFSAKIQAVDAKDPRFVERNPPILVERKEGDENGDAYYLALSTNFLTMDLDLGPVAALGLKPGIDYELKVKGLRNPEVAYTLPETDGGKSQKFRIDELIFVEKDQWPHRVAQGQPLALNLKATSVYGRKITYSGTVSHPAFGALAVIGKDGKSSWKPENHHVTQRQYPLAAMTVKVQAADDLGNVISDSFPVTVTDVNDPPTGLFASFPAPVSFIPRPWGPEVATEITLQVDDFDFDIDVGESYSVTVQLSAGWEYAIVNGADPGEYFLKLKTPKYATEPTSRQYCDINAITARDRAGNAYNIPFSSGNRPWTKHWGPTGSTHQEIDHYETGVVVSGHHYESVKDANGKKLCLFDSAEACLAGVYGHKDAQGDIYAGTEKHWMYSADYSSTRTPVYKTVADKGWVD